jgi:Holliday junction resolvase
METTGMPNTRYRSGVRLERKIRKILEGYGNYCLRTAGSKSDFDLVALGMRTLLIQVKYTSKKNLAPPLGYVQSLEKYTAKERCVVIVVVQRKTLKTFIGLLQHTFDRKYMHYSHIICDFEDAMLILSQLPFVYDPTLSDETNNP